MKYDIAIIGGGPAGMMAAGRAGELGACVVLIEKNRNLGVKLLMTGNGRCNITNLAEDAKEIADKFGRNGKFLFSALNVFSVQDTMEFFRSKDVEIMIEDRNKAYPASNKAQDVLDALVKYLSDGGAEIMAGSGVMDLVKTENRIEKAFLGNGDEVLAEKFIIATGGLSHPISGSTGDGFGWARKLGHNVTKLYPVLTPVILNESFIEELEGLSLKNVGICIYKRNRKLDERRGDAIFTKNGMSGPAVLDLSKQIGMELPEILLKVDLVPDLDFEKLDRELQKDFYVKKNKLFKNSLDNILPKRLAPVIVKISGIDPLKKVNSISKAERRIIIHLLKEFALSVKELVGFDNAVVTSGGIRLNEVDPKTMRSKMVENLYFAGEILDLDGPTGGFNLQMCWSTGFVAGQSAAKK